MIRTLGIFAAGALAGLIALAGAFYLRAGDYGLLCVAVAGTICIIPTLTSLALTLWSRSRSGSEQLMAVMGGMALRMGGVLFVSVAVFLSVPQFREGQERELVYWSAVLISYMGTLAWETLLAAKKKTAPRDTGPAPAAGGGN